MENKIVVANFKMNMLISDIEDYINKFKYKDYNVVICPTNIHLNKFIEHGYKVGIQNICSHEQGAYTGEVSAKQAKDLGCKYVIIGHSERRKNYNESDVDINQKIKIALKNGLSVILCIGETYDEKISGDTKKVLKRQLENTLKDIDDIFNIIIAYEPIWSIGTNKVPTNEELFDTVCYIKDVVSLLFHGEHIKVIYGGSVNSDNIDELNKIANLSGFLVGGASLKVDEFSRIIEAVL